MKDTLRVVIVYEYAEAGARAREVLRRVSDRTELGLEMESDAWKFDWLQHPDLRDCAARQAAEADMILLAARDPDHLPDHIRDWIQNWLPSRQGNTAAFIAIFEDQDHPETPASYRACLVEMAGKGNADFFWQTGATRTPGLPGAIPAGMDTSAMRSIPPRETQRHWGINE